MTKGHKPNKKNPGTSHPCHTKGCPHRAKAMYACANKPREKWYCAKCARKASDNDTKCPCCGVKYELEVPA